MQPPQEDFSHEVRKHDSLTLRALFAVLGGVFLAAGAAGIFLPVLPTVPLWLVAAACFARSSTRVYNWMLNHRHFGHPLREWRRHRAIPWRAKRAGIALIALSFAVTIVFLLDEWPARLAVGVSGIALGSWLWNLPSRDAPPGRD